MAQNSPKVSIGMPLYNEERFLSETLDCLLAQDHENIEIIISDNASADCTPEICRTYAGKDARIQIHRLETPVDASENFNRVVRLSKGKYFMWAAGHDRYAPNFVGACVREMEQDPSVVLCYPEIQPMDYDGTLHEVQPTPLATQGIPGPLVRFLLTFWHLGGYQIYGLFRSEVLKQTQLWPHHTMAPDLVLIYELSLRGTFACVRAPLYFPRNTWTSEKSFDDVLHRYTKTMFFKKKLSRFWFPHWRYFYEQISRIAGVPLSFRRKAMLLPFDAGLFILKNYKMLAQDLWRPFSPRGSQKSSQKGSRSSL